MPEITDEMADRLLMAMMGDGVILDRENRDRMRIMACEELGAPLVGRCPICTLICPADMSPDPTHPSLVRLRWHSTRRLVAHTPADLLTPQRDVVMACIGTRADVRPYTGPADPGTYLERRPT